MQRRLFLAGLGAASLAPSLAPAKQVRKFAEELKNGEFNWFPERSPSGPVLIIVSIPDQRVHVYRNGIRIAASSCSTGKKGHATPTGVFTILQKDKDHKSSTYDDAAMPNMNRLTWDGIALHAGNLPGYPASHGCVRLPLDFSELLFTVTRLGMTVIIADTSTFPATIVHPGILLDDDVLGQFKAAEKSILKREYAKRAEPAAPVTSIVASAQDRRMTVLENGIEVASGRVTVKGPTGRLGEQLYTLSGTDGVRKSFRWISTGLSARNAEKTAPAQFSVEPKLMAEISTRAHLGMSMLLTDGPADATSRSKPGFRILTA